MEKSDILNSIRSVIDPEIGINIVDLGLIYDISINDTNDAEIRMTMTSMGCPMQQIIRDEMTDILKLTFPEIGNIEILLVWDPPWTPEKMSASAREKLGW